jgi:UDP-N-acetylmuramyl pentapeptide phosphotransferase/UDP-N-acetylglucosamine-1-phosphate transferase
MVAAFLLCMLFAAAFHDFDARVLEGFLLTSAAIAVLGAIDDLRSLSRRERLATWIVIGVVAMAFGIRLEAISLPGGSVISLGLWGWPITFLWLIGVTNLYNFMDGIDGIAAGQAVVAAAFLAVVSRAAGNQFLTVAALLLLGSAAGFLPHNVPPAKVFMGDGGSNFLGFVFAALAVIGAQTGSDHGVPFVIVVILLGTFLFDGTVTLLRRLPKGKDWLEPHRDHYYQRLIRLGYSHRQVTSLYCGTSVLLGAVALLYGRFTGLVQWAPVGVVAALLLSIVVTTRTLEARIASSPSTSTPNP